jgi:hypothetical protein
MKGKPFWREDKEKWKVKELAREGRDYLKRWRKTKGSWPFVMGEHTDAQWKREKATIPPIVKTGVSRADNDQSKSFGMLLENHAQVQVLRHSRFWWGAPNVERLAVTTGRLELIKYQLPLVTSWQLRLMPSSVNHISKSFAEDNTLNCLFTK